MPFSMPCSMPCSMPFSSPFFNSLFHSSFLFLLSLHGRILLLHPLKLSPLRHRLAGKKNLDSYVPIYLSLFCKIGSSFIAISSNSLVKCSSSFAESNKSQRTNGSFHGFTFSSCHCSVNFGISIMWISMSSLRSFCCCVFHNMLVVWKAGCSENITKFSKFMVMVL